MYIVGYTFIKVCLIILYSSRICICLCLSFCFYWLFKSSIHAI